MPKRPKGLPAILQYDVRGYVSILHKNRNKVPLGLRTLPEHRLNGHLQQEKRKK